MIGFTSSVVQQKLKETVDIIDPNIKPYVAPEKKAAARRRRRRRARNPARIEGRATRVQEVPRATHYCET